MLDYKAYKTSESINAPSSCLELLAKFLLKDKYYNAFLANAFFLSKADAKLQTFRDMAKYF